MRSLHKMFNHAVMGMVFISFFVGSSVANERKTFSPFLSVSKTSLSPSIDGKIDQFEWQSATRFTGFVNLSNGQLDKPAVHTYLTYDDEKLYLAFDCPLESEAAPAASENMRDGSVYNDDSVELIIFPLSGDEKEFYHFIGNSIGTIYDDHKRDRKWNGKWEYKTDSGMGWWRGELSIPFSELNIKNPLGQIWRVNIGRNVGKYLSWSDTGRGYINMENSAYVEFAHDSPVLQIDSIEGQSGKKIVKGRVYNPGPKAAQSIIGIRIADANDPPRWSELGNKWRQDRRFNTAPGRWQDFIITVSTTEQKAKRLDIALRGYGDGKDLYHQSIPFIVSDVHYVELLAEPSEEIIFVRSDMSGFNISEFYDLKLEVRHKQKDWSTTLEYKGLNAGKPQMLKENICQWPLGQYDVNVCVTSKSLSEPIYRDTVLYERREMPQWYKKGSEIGLSRKVLKPWTPIDWDGKNLNVLGRNHDFKDNLFPKQIAIAQEQILAKPITLNASINKKEFTASMSVRKTISSDPDVVTTDARGMLGSLKIDVSTTAEYDGMIKFKVKIDAPEPTLVESIALVLSVRSQNALYYHYASHYYSRGASAAIPKDGLSIPFKPFVWLGDNERGIMWFAESMQDWHIENDPIHIQPHDTYTELRIELINKPLLISNPRTIVFGLQATPVKPVPKDWRSWRADWYYHKFRKNKFVDWEKLGIPLNWRYLWWHDNGKPLFTQGHMTPLQIKPELAEYVKQTHDKGTPLVAYYYLHGVNKITQDFDRYFPSWKVAKPREMLYYKRIIMGACPGSSMGDLFLSGAENIVKNYGVDGFYFDGAGPPVPCDNQLHGHGYIDEKGNRQPIYPIFSLRSFYKRLATLLSEHSDTPIIWTHMDGKMTPPCISFATSNWEGEFVQGRMKADGAYLSDITDMDYWRSHGLATQWGLVPMWLPATFGSPGQRINQGNDMLAVLLVHGTPIGRVGGLDTDILKRIWRAQADFDIGKAKFYGYWENSDSLKVSPQHNRIVASYYKKDGRYMIIVSNFTKQSQHVTLEFLKETRGLLFEDIILNDKFDPSKGNVELSIDAKSFRMLVSK